MTSSPNLDQLTPEQLRALAAQLLSQVDTLGKTVETMGKKIDRDHPEKLIETVRGVGYRIGKPA